MRLVYEETGEEVKIGDVVDIGMSEMVTVDYFRPPHKPSSSGKVTVGFGKDNRGGQIEYYVGVIGAEWIEREDR